MGNGDREIVRQKWRERGKREREKKEKGIKRQRV